MSVMEYCTCVAMLDFDSIPVAFQSETRLTAKATELHLAGWMGTTRTVTRSNTSVSRVRGSLIFISQSTRRFSLLRNTKIYTFHRILACNATVSYGTTTEEASNGYLRQYLGTHLSKA
jgi:hypothetical protein